MDNEYERPDLIMPEFYMVPTYVAQLVSPQEALVFAVIYWFEKMKDGRCFASNERLALSMPNPTSPETIGNCLKTLEDCGLIKRIFKKGSNTHRKEIITLYQISKGNKSRPTTGCIQPHHTVVLAPPGGVQNKNTYTEELNILRLEKEKVLNSKPKILENVVESESFEEFMANKGFGRFEYPSVSGDTDVEDAWGTSESKRLSEGKVRSYELEYNKKHKKIDLTTGQIKAPNLTKGELNDFVYRWNQLGTRPEPTVNYTVHSKFLPHCRKITPDLERVWLELGKKGYKIEDVKEAMSNYLNDICGRDPSTDYAKHRFSCYEFLSKENGFIKFYNK